jgi:hypothetical protein
MLWLLSLVISERFAPQLFPHFWFLRSHLAKVSGTLNYKVKAHPFEAFVIMSFENWQMGPLFHCAEAWDGTQPGGCFQRSAWNFQTNPCTKYNVNFEVVPPRVDAWGSSLPFGQAIIIWWSTSSQLQVSNPVRISTDTFHEIGDILAILECCSCLMIPKSIHLRILKDPFHRFDPLLQFLSEVHIWRPPIV